jgi:glucosamine--fructose-6-phosphate aminotransferase (isomerizing)
MDPQGGAGVTDPDRAPGARMEREIAEQPAALQRLLDDGRAAVAQVAAQIATRRPRFVLLAARGTSDHAALYAKYLIEIGLGLPAGLASPSTLTAYGSRPDLSDVLWITVSQSGGSPDLIDSAAAARRCGALTVAVTNAAQSALACACDLHLDVLAGPELSVAATKSYTSELLALYLLVEHWRSGPGDGVETIPELAAEVLGRRLGDQLAPRYRFVERLVVTARGYAYPTARETALKMMETSYLSAHAFSGADLLHGPLAMVDQDRPVIAIIAPGEGGRALGPVLERLHDRRADVLAVGDVGAAPWAAASAALPPTDERLAPILQILPLQQLAHAMAVARGYDPDAPRGLAKVTETR